MMSRISAMKKTLLVIVVLGGTMAGYGFYDAGAVDLAPDVATVAVTVGDIVDTVGATGTLEAVTTVQVGSQVSGIIQELYVDFNSIVREGDVLMRLDPSLFETQLEQARANLLRSEAEVERLSVAVDDAVAQLRRARQLAASDLISETELEAAEVTLRAAEAQIKSAEAEARQSQASLRMNQVNLEHTVIRAPIDGIVTSRLVDIGQTVAASFQAPELFVIAADLTRMRVIANIDESDVGRIRPNQRVTFTVDAFPAEEFEGTVSQVRLEPIVTQNVVTYATVIDAPNPALKLKPGMTATVAVEVARRDDVTRIPNSALRFRPTPAVFAALGQPLAPGLEAGRQGGEAAPDPERRQRIEQMSPEERQEFFASMRERPATDGPDVSASPGSRPPTAPRRLGNADDGPTVPAVERGVGTMDALFAPIEVEETTGRVWVLEGGRFLGLRIRVGISDGITSELLDVIGGSPMADGSPAVPSITNGVRLITSVTTPDGSGPEARSSSSASPLMPQSPFGRRGR